MKRKNLFKAFFCIIFALVLALCCFGGCTEYKPPVTDPSIPEVPDDPDPDNPNPDNPDPDKPNPDIPEEKESFTVQLTTLPERELVHFTKSYYLQTTATVNNPLSWSDIKVQWTHKRTGARYYASPDDDGKATVYPDIDGDFKVTIAVLPTGFTYDPNPPENNDDPLLQHEVNNNNRDIEIELYKLRPLGLKTDYKYGTFYYYTLNGEGAYAITLTGKNDKQMFKFKPSGQGKYFIRTMIDTTADLINPIIDVRYGNDAYITEGEPAYTQDAGFPEEEEAGLFSTNVNLNFEVAPAYVGSAYFFELYSVPKDDPKGYPITVHFRVQRTEDYVNPIATVIRAEEDFKNKPDDPDGTFRYSVDRPGVTNKQLNQGSVMLNIAEPKMKTEFDRQYSSFREEFVGSKQLVLLNTVQGLGKKSVDLGAKATANDGKYYYFTYDETAKKYTLGDEVVGNTLDVVALGEYANVNDGYYYYFEYDETKKIYTLTDRLYAKLKSPNQIMNFGDTSVRVNLLHDYDERNYNYTFFLNAYRRNCNSDGVYAVSEEVKWFLQRYAITFRVFDDGGGSAENVGYNANEESMWMFACGYYA